ncbi:MAG: hypothetical protein ACYS1A_10210 [Planctomycetota bacterium]|jgi:hypothetical protein
MNSEQLEKYSSALTLSDMEIFVFPELMYSLVLANIMSPVIWQWRQLDCFKKLEGKSSYKKLMRLKQFIMDEYEFNLDLETWGLTSKSKEVKRFEKFISPDDIAKSNALFGYHGDKYYFDVDIRKHFGLDKYDSDIIPYWKTETVEAMDAFLFKSGYTKKAGECVSLAALYAAAAFIVCGIPLEDIYMILTPLHSQNFVDIQDGVLTNNRRLVTKTMWFNGTAISNKAQRALRNEQVTILAHNTGFVHCFYNDATMKKQAYEHFAQRLGEYLSTGLTTLTLANFLRSHPNYQKYFQFCCEHCKGGAKFAKAEVLFHYEHGSNFRIADDTFERLLAEVSSEDISPYKLPDRMCCDQLCSFIKYENADIREQAGRMVIKKYLTKFVPQVDAFLQELVEFLHIEAKLPGFDKNFVIAEPIKLSVNHSREQIIDYLKSIRKNNATADLAFYAYRDMENCDWAPFIKAATERNPVSVEIAGSMPVEEAYQWLEQMNNTSIYDGKRLAQPDEVANYQRGDGLEKAFLLANVLRQRNPEQDIKIMVDNNDVILKGQIQYRFASDKGFKELINIPLGEFYSD